MKMCYMIKTTIDKDNMLVFYDITSKFVIGMRETKHKVIKDFFNSIK